MGIRGHIPWSADDGQGLNELRTSQDVIETHFPQVWGAAYFLRNFPKEPLKDVQICQRNLLWSHRLYSNTTGEIWTPKQDMILRLQFQCHALGSSWDRVKNLKPKELVKFRIWASAMPTSPALPASSLTQNPAAVSTLLLQGYLLSATWPGRRAWGWQKPPLRAPGHQHPHRSTLALKAHTSLSELAVWTPQSAVPQQLSCNGMSTPSRLKQNDWC